MNKGFTNLEVTFYLVGAVSAIAAYAHSTFITYREVTPVVEQMEKRFDRLEGKVDNLIERGK